MSSIRVLKNFIAVTRHPSVAAAAREIGLTPAAAGQQLAQLEGDIGVALLIAISAPWFLIIKAAL